MLTAENLRVRKSGTVPNECREERRVERKFRGKTPHQKETRIRGNASTKTVVQDAGTMVNLSQSRVQH